MDEKDRAQAQLSVVAPQPGRYRHYKGGEYELLLTAIDEATLEPLVVYRSLSQSTVWVRTLENWNETVAIGGTQVNRFEYLPD